MFDSLKSSPNILLLLLLLLLLELLSLPLPFLLQTAPPM